MVAGANEHVGGARGSCRAAAGHAAGLPAEAACTTRTVHDLLVRYSFSPPSHPHCSLNSLSHVQLMVRLEGVGVCLSHRYADYLLGILVQNTMQLIEGRPTGQASAMIAGKGQAAKKAAKAARAAAHRAAEKGVSDLAHLALEV